MKSPYSSLPLKSFWGKSVRDKHYYELENLSHPIDIKKSDKIATAGSCFAQHIGRHLQSSGFNYLDMEPKPEFIDIAQAKRFGYQIYSCRYGNIYTTRQLLQLAQEVLESRKPAEVIWANNTRFFDSLRPSVDPAGYSSKEAVCKMRSKHLLAVKKMLEKVDVFVFTLGLTEAWVSRLDDTVFPTAPGTIAGSYDEKLHYFENFRYNDIYQDLKNFRDLVKKINPSFKMLLTVSPVPLNATASNDHVLVASLRSKSVLRAVAGDISEDYSDVFLFPFL